jgi:two-component system, cell cycle response regulator
MAYPEAEQAVVTPKPNENKNPVAGTDRPCVLVADDSRVIRRAIVKALSADFELIEATDGEIAWQQLSTDERVQVVITDMEMPKLDGDALIGRIRKADTQRIRTIPIIVITGAQDDATRRRAFACGATDFVTKPIDNLQLLARTRAHVRFDETTRALDRTTKSLEEQAALDPLTELHSRRYFVERATQDISYANRHNLDLAVIRLDFDNFRAVYKQLGDDACDQLFIWLAGLMRANTRVEDTPARIRGGEFAILAPSASRRDASVVCERLRMAVAARPFAYNGVTVPVTISLGLSTLHDDRLDTVEQLLKLAERRLALARTAGGNRLGADDGAVSAPLQEETVLEQPGLEAALHMLSNGDGAHLLPYLPELLTRVIPLLETCDRQLDLNLGPVLHSLKTRLGLVKQ